MYAVIGNYDSKLSIPTLAETEIDTDHDLFRSVSDAEDYIEEQTGTYVDADNCPLRVVAVRELDDRDKSDRRDDHGRTGTNEGNQ